MNTEDGEKIRHVGPLANSDKRYAVSERWQMIMVTWPREANHANQVHRELLKILYVVVTAQAHCSNDFVSARVGAIGSCCTARSPLRISTIAPKIATEASTTRAVSGSAASSHPSSTATTGLA